MPAQSLKVRHGVTRQWHSQTLDADADTEGNDKKKALDTVDRVEGVYNAAVTLAGASDESADSTGAGKISFPVPPAQRLEGLRIEDCCTLARH